MGVRMLAIVFGVQAVIIAVVVLRLRLKLDAQLIDTALRQLAAQEASAGKNVTVVTRRPLTARDQDRFRRAAAQGPGAAAAVVFSVEAALQGGALVRVGEAILDHSLRDRLRRAFGR